MRGGADRRGLRKPLVVMTPKSLLRHPKVVSTVDELASGVFHTVLDDASRDRSRQRDPDSGVYRQDLLRAAGGARSSRRRRSPSCGWSSCIRFRRPSSPKCCGGIPRRSTWCGCRKSRATWARGRSCAAISSRCWEPNQAIGYAGRPRSASPAPGSPKAHQREQAHLIEAAFAAPTVARLGRKRLIRQKERTLTARFARELGGGDRLAQMALRVFGDVHQQAQHGRRQTLFPDIARLVQHGSRSI